MILLQITNAYGLVMQTGQGFGVTSDDQYAKVYMPQKVEYPVAQSKQQWWVISLMIDQNNIAICNEVDFLTTKKMIISTTVACTKVETAFA